jgi:hypothetical protein
MSEYGELVESTLSLAALIGKHCAYRNEQRKRGANDFNIFAIVRRIEDEEGLHSRFIHHLLDSSADHGQGTLFLKEFLSECEIPNFNLERAKAYREYNRIDLYLTDETKHVLIENKINAGDQESQIERYVTSLRNENKHDRDFYENLTVVYLTLNREFPSSYSLGNIKNLSDGMQLDGSRFEFRSIHYKKQIKNWISKCLGHVSNITNLTVGLQQYLDVIDKLNNTYQERLMSLYDFISDENMDTYDILRNMDLIAREAPQMKKQFMEEFFEEVKREIENKFVEMKIKDWVVSIEGDLQTKYDAPFRIRYIGIDVCKVCYGLDFEGNDYHMPLIGIVRTDRDIDLGSINKNEKIQNLLTPIDDGFMSSLPAWLRFQQLWKVIGARNTEQNLFQEIVSNEKNVLVSKVADALLGVFNRYEYDRKVVENANKILLGE